MAKKKCTTCGRWGNRCLCKNTKGETASSAGSTAAKIPSTKSTTGASSRSPSKPATTSSDENSVLKLQLELAVLRAKSALADKELEVLKTKEAVGVRKAKRKADKIAPVQQSQVQTFRKPYRPKASDWQWSQHERYPGEGWLSLRNDGAN